MNYTLVGRAVSAGVFNMCQENVHVRSRKHFDWRSERGLKRRNGTGNLVGFLDVVHLFWNKSLDMTNFSSSGMKCCEYLAIRLVGM
jgi:hypothetical protein